MKAHWVSLAPGGHDVIAALRVAIRVFTYFATYDDRAMTIAARVAFMRTRLVSKGWTNRAAALAKAGAGELVAPAGRAHDDGIAMSALCQKRTYAAQQDQPLFEHPVGEHE